LGGPNIILNKKTIDKKPMAKVLLKLSLPAMIGMFFQSTFNLVDSIFVGNITGNQDQGLKALTALSVLYPVQLIIIALAVGTGTGVASLMARTLGEGKKRDAERIANTSILIGLLLSIISALSGIIFSSSIMSLFTNNPEIVRIGTNYLELILIFSFGIYITIIGERILQGRGNTVTPMIIMGGTALLNIVLDPILIFGLGPIPASGVKGAAWATVASRTIGFLAVLFILFKQKLISIPGIMKVIKKPDSCTVKGIGIVGVPALTVQILGGISLGIMNFIFGGISLYSIAILGIYFKLQSFIMMPILGMGHGFLSFFGFSWGAGRYQYLRRGLKKAVMWSLILSFIGYAIIMIFPDLIISIFNPDGGLVSPGSKAFRRIGLLFFLSGPVVMITIYFQALGKGIQSLIIILLQKIIILIPFALFLSQASSLINIWLAYPIATIWALVLAIVLVRKSLRDLGDTLISRPGIPD